MTGGLTSASTLIQQGRAPEARALLKDLLRHNVRDSQAWLLLSQCVESEDQKRQCLRRVLALEPGHPAAQAMLDQMDAPPISTAASDTPLPGPEPHLEATTAVKSVSADPTPIDNTGFVQDGDGKPHLTATATETPTPEPVVSGAQTYVGNGLMQESESPPKDELGSDFSPAAVGPALAAAYVASTTPKPLSPLASDLKPARLGEEPPFQPQAYAREQAVTGKFEPKSFTLTDADDTSPNMQTVRLDWPEWLRTPLD